MSGYSPAGDFRVAEVEAYPSIEKRLSEAEEKIEIMGKIFQTFAKFLGYKPK